VVPVLLWNWPDVVLEHEWGGAELERTVFGECFWHPVALWVIYFSGRRNNHGAINRVPEADDGDGVRELAWT
jgi:hypothetical protein